MIPAIGEMTIGMTILSRMPPHFTVAPAAGAAPASPPVGAGGGAPRATPPMSAWEDEDGRPYHQVSMFQPVAPIRAAPTRIRPCMPDGASMMPLPTVAATF